MKPIRVTGYSALLLSLASLAVAQQNPVPADFVPLDSAVAQPPALPVAEAKKRYLESQKHLEELAKGGGFAEVGFLGTEPEIAVVRATRDRLRAAVAEAYDARRRLQQAELAELERRIANIKRALAISDAMKETIIEQRTDELLDQIENGGKGGQRDGASPSGEGRPANSSANEGVTTVPAESDGRSIETDADVLILDVEEARVSLDAAERAYKRSLNLLESGAIEQAVADEQAEKYQRAEIQVQRAQMKFDAFVAAHGSDRRSTNQASADGHAAKAEKNPRLAELDVQEAEANLAAAKIKYERFKRHYADKAIEQSLLDEQAEKYKRAQIELERANTKLKALDGPPAAGDRRQSLDNAPVE